MKFQRPLYSICLTVVITLSLEGAWAQEKVLIDAEKCLMAAIHEERKKPKPRATSVIKSCTREMEALPTYSPPTDSGGPDGKNPDTTGRVSNEKKFEDSEIFVKNPKPFDSIN